MDDRVSIEGLRHARAVAEAGSFSAAARVRGVTQPALSNGIAKLEERLGQQLFERSTKGTVLTAFGEHILPVITQALEATEAVAIEAARLAARVDETIKVGISPLIDATLVAATYDAVRGLPPLPHPQQRQLILHEANMDDLRSALTAGELDLILIPSVGPLPQYEHRIIASEPVVLVGPDATTTNPAGLEEVQNSQLILLPDTCGLTTFTQDLIRTHDLTMHAYAGEAASYRMLEEWAALGLGAAVLPRSKLANPHTPHRRLRDVDGHDIEIFYEGVWHPNSPLAQELRTIVDRLGLPG